jgi:hypothetical protein
LLSHLFTAIFLGIITEYQGEVDMAFDAFIQIADIPGEALDEKYSKWIEITG